MDVDVNLSLQRKGKRYRDAGDGGERQLTEELQNMTRNELVARCAKLNLRGNVQENKADLQQRIARFMDLPLLHKSAQSAANNVSTGPISKRARRLPNPRSDEDDINDEEDDGDDDEEKKEEEADDDDDDEDSIILLQTKMENALQQFNEYMEYEGKEYKIDSEFKTINSATSSKASATESDLVRQDVLCNCFILYRWDKGWEACKDTRNHREGKFNYVMKDHAGEEPCDKTKVRLLLSMCLPSDVNKAAPSSWIPLRLVR